MSNLPEALVRWHGAEGALGRARAVERTAGKLEPRLGWLLRAMAALDDGRRDEIERIRDDARAAGQPDVAAVLGLLLADPATVDPSRVRKEAKAARLDAHSGLPFLDLLRSLAVFRTGKDRPPSTALRAHTNERPVLKSIVHLLTSRSDHVLRYPGLVECFARAEQVAIAARALRQWGSVDAAFIEQNFERNLIGLDPGGWDLGEAGGVEGLRRRLAGDEPWSSGHDELSEWLYELPHAERQRWLGPMVHAITRQLHAGRVVGLAGMVHAAAHLAARDRALIDLCRQLVALDMRLRWADSSEPPAPPLLIALWQERSGSLPREERLVLARQLLELPLLEESMAAALAIAAHTSDLDELESVVEICLFDQDRAAIVRGLGREKPTTARSRLVLALLDAAGGRSRAALEAVPALVDQGEARAAARLASRLSGESLPARGVHAALEALASQPPSAAIMRGLIVLSRGSRTSPPAVAAAAAAGASSDDIAVRGPSVALLCLVGQADAARQWIRDEGRALRRMAADAADDRALAFMAHALHAMDEDVDEAVDEALAPLLHFLLRSGPERVLAAARRAAPVLRPSIVTVYLRHRLALDTKGWRAFLMGALLVEVEAQPQDIGALQGLLDDAFEAEVTSWGALCALIDDSTEDGPEIPEAMFEIFRKLSGEIPF